MLELILAGVIIGAVCVTAVVTGVRDHRGADRLATEADREPRGEPIPSGWPHRSSVGRQPPSPEEPR